MWYQQVCPKSTKTIRQEIVHSVIRGFPQKTSYTGKNDRHMGSHCIIRQGPPFLCKAQMAFADFEKDLDISAFSMNADDFIFIYFNVDGDQA